MLAMLVTCKSVYLLGLYRYRYFIGIGADICSIGIGKLINFIGSDTRDDIRWQDGGVWAVTKMITKRRQGYRWNSGFFKSLQLVKPAPRDYHTDYSMDNCDRLPTVFCCRGWRFPSTVTSISHNNEYRLYFCSISYFCNIGSSENLYWKKAINIGYRYRV